LPIGSDRLSAIGVPRGGGGGGGGEDALQAWRDVFDHMFPVGAFGSKQTPTQTNENAVGAFWGDRTS